MNYNIKGTDVELTQEVHGYVEKQVALHIEKFLKDDTTAKLDVELEFISGAAGPKYRAEFTCGRGKEVFYAEASGMTLHEAIDLAVAEINKELARAKGKRLRLMHVGAGKIKKLFRGF